MLCVDPCLHHTSHPPAAAHKFNISADQNPAAEVQRPNTCWRRDATGTLPTILSRDPNLSIRPKGDVETGFKRRTCFLSKWGEPFTTLATLPHSREPSGGGTNKNTFPVVKSIPLKTNK